MNTEETRMGIKKLTCSLDKRAEWQTVHRHLSDVRVSSVFIRGEMILVRVHREEAANATLPRDRGRVIH